MISLKSYMNYWEGIAATFKEDVDVMPVTLDDAMANKIQQIRTGRTTLFILPPSASADARDVDNFTERCPCVLFLLKKFDPQRSNSWSTLEETQPLMEAIKRRMVEDQAAGCPLMQVDVASFNTQAETQFFAGFAGWSLGFTVKS